MGPLPPPGPPSLHSAHGRQTDPDEGLSDRVASLLKPLQRLFRSLPVRAKFSQQFIYPTSWVPQPHLTPLTPLLPPLQLHKPPQLWIHQHGPRLIGPFLLTPRTLFSQLSAGCLSFQPPSLYSNAAFSVRHSLAAPLKSQPLNTLPPSLLRPSLACYLIYHLSLY